MPRWAVAYKCGDQCFYTVKEDKEPPETVGCLNFEVVFVKEVLPGEDPTSSEFKAKFKIEAQKKQITINGL